MTASPDPKNAIRLHDYADRLEQMGAALMASRWRELARSMEAGRVTKRAPRIRFFARKAKRAVGKQTAAYGAAAT
jgi:hypothetical protein